MTELSWLLDLFLHHKLPTKTREHVATRIGEVEILMANKPMGQAFVPFAQPTPIVVNGSVQSPSFVAAMQKHEPQPEPQTTSVIVASPQAALAMQSRAQAISQAQSGKPEPGRTSPRKF